jgi:phage-related protein
VDTPQLIELRGDVENPIIELTSTGEDGETMVGIMRLVGTVDENNPVFIDVGTGRIYDAAGANRYSMLSSGSLHHFQPGHNHLQVSATNWSPYPAQVYASWRDALS